MHEPSLASREGTHTLLDANFVKTSLSQN
jgi:hypothetical protein